MKLRSVATCHSQKFLLWRHISQLGQSHDSTQMLSKVTITSIHDTGFIHICQIKIQGLSRPQKTVFQGPKNAKPIFEKPKYIAKLPRWTVLKRQFLCITETDSQFCLQYIVLMVLARKTSQRGGKPPPPSHLGGASNPSQPL